jgi:small-conductance mechanosensitive channel
VLAAWWVRRRHDASAWQRYTFPLIAFLFVLFLTVVLMLNALGLAGPIVSSIVTVGLALGVIADSFSGFRIFGSRPFSVGDVIEIKGEDVIGIVTQISLSGTALKLTNNTEVIVPNRKLLDKLVISHSPGSGRRRFRLQLVLDQAQTFRC